MVDVKNLSNKILAGADIRKVLSIVEESKMSSSVKDKILELYLEGNLMLTGFSWGDIDIVNSDSGTIEDLRFLYATDKSSGELNLGDVDFEYYFDDGDPVIDLNGNLYLLYPDDAQQFKGDLPKGISYKPVTTSSNWDWSDFFEPILDILYDFE